MSLELTYIHTTIYKIANKDLLYSTGNNTKYFVITYKIKESEKECIHTYIYIYIQKRNCCIVHLKLIGHDKSTVLQLKNLKRKGKKKKIPLL